jgi:hypothetical protein
MSLNIVSQGSGTFDPYIKFNGKAGRFYMKGESGEVEVTPTTFVADLENIKTGWLLFAAGMAPDRVWDKSLTEAAPRPSQDHKRGFLIRLYSKQTFGGVVELSSNSMHICNAVNDLYTQYETKKGENIGKVPVVKLVTVTPMKDKHGTNYKPEFTIEKWTERPAELDATAAKQETPAKPAVVSEF